MTGLPEWTDLLPGFNPIASRYLPLVCTGRFAHTPELIALWYEAVDPTFGPMGFGLSPTPHLRETRYREGAGNVGDSVKEISPNLDDDVRVMLGELLDMIPALEQQAMTGHHNMLTGSWVATCPAPGCARTVRCQNETLYDLCHAAREEKLPWLDLSHVG